VIGLPYPGGAALDKLAYEGDTKAYTLPSPALTGDTLDFSFSGLKTAALNLINQAKQKEEEIDRANLAASYTHAIVRGVSKKVGQALVQTGHKTVVLAGGVAANSHLRRELENTCKRHGARLVTPPISLCGDNGAMVAAAGYFEYLEGKRADTSLNASANDDGN
jgi:N6-L-threonylcarbamoyladenine synthase